MHKSYSFLLLFLVIVTANATELRIAVSDLIAGHISETVQKLAEKNAIEVSVIGVGSLTAIDSLRSDEIPLAVLAAPENVDSAIELDDTYETFTIAYSSAVIAVNKANPINELSFRDLQGIFGSNPDLNIETWGTLGVENLVNRSIKPLIRQNEVGISTELFRHLVLGATEMKLTVNELTDVEIEKMLIDNVTTVAILPYLPNTEKIKALMVSKDSQNPAFSPNDDNVYFGDYPIRLPFQIAYRKDRKAELVKVLRILLSDDVTKALRENHFYVLPDGIRTNFVKSLDLID